MCILQLGLVDSIFISFDENLLRNSTQKNFENNFFIATFFTQKKVLEYNFLPAYLISIFLHIHQALGQMHVHKKFQKITPIFLLQTYVTQFSMVPLRDNGHLGLNKNENEEL